jgi:hypothetical protein
MLEPWGDKIFNSNESGTWLHLVILHALMICIVWGSAVQIERSPLLHQKRVNATRCAANSDRG